MIKKDERACELEINLFLKEEEAPTGKSGLIARLIRSFHPEYAPKHLAPKGYKAPDLDVPDL